MRCDLARRQISLALDGELPPRQAEELDLHTAACPGCSAYLAQLNRIRRELRYEPLEEVPDVAPRVLAALARSLPRRRLRWAPVAAAFVAGIVAGAVLVGLDRNGPREVVALDIPERILEVQHSLTSLSARVRVVERGWHSLVVERAYQGSLRYQAPESLALLLSDRTAYPTDYWVPNHTTLVVDEDLWWAQGPAPCPTEAQPDCTPEQPRRQSVRRREPFSDATPVPLDLVVPVASFTLAEQPPVLGLQRVSDRLAVGVVVTAAQVQPLLEGLRQAGNWREVYPTDSVELWLDQESMIPLRMEIRSDGNPERDLWAARHGYRDRSGTSILEWTLEDVEVNGDLPAESFPPPPPQTVADDAGFLATPEFQGPEPTALPAGLKPYRFGTIDGPAGPAVQVGSWTDGRAWLTVQITRDWPGSRLFGEPGEVVRRVDLGPGGVGYVGEGGSSVALHGRTLELVVTGTLAEAELRRVAASFGVEGLLVPQSWEEASTASLAQAAEALPGLLVPDGLVGFGPPGVRVSGEVVTLAFAGPGTRAFVLVERPGAVLNPPLEPDVRGVRVRGTIGRYSPTLGELEWVEGGLVMSLRSPSLSLSELAQVATGLAPR